MAYNIPRPLSLQPQGFMGGATPLLSGLQAGMGLAQQAQQMQANRQAQELNQIQLDQAQAAQAQQDRNQMLSSVAQGAEDMLSVMSGEGKNEQQAKDYLLRRVDSLASQGRDTSHTEEAVDTGLRFGFDSPQMQQVLQAGLQGANSEGVYTPRQAMEREQAAKLAAQEAKNVGEIRKEVRSSVGKAVTKLGDQAAVLSENYGKLENLTKQINKGNRSAVSQALVALVKLGDPGSIVKESEMEAAMNMQNPLAALQEKGVSTDVVEAFLRKADPLNPNNINVDELLATARAQMAANVPSIQGQYSEQRARAEGNLTERGVNSIFEKRLDNRISDLSRFIDDQTGSEQPQQFTSQSGISFTVE